MKVQFALLFAISLASFSLSSCGVQQERKVVLPQSNESELPWNGLLEGEGLGQFGALQRR